MATMESLFVLPPVSIRGHVDNAVPERVVHTSTSVDSPHLHIRGQRSPIAGCPRVHT